jgi:hypothetical protein
VGVISLNRSTRSIGIRLSDQAERLRGLAAKANSPAVQRDYRELASEWDMMAEQIEMLCRDRIISTTER